MKILGNNLPGKLLTLAAATSLLAACSNEPTATHEAAPAKKAEAGETVASKAIAMLEPTQGNNVKGKVVLTERSDGVHMQISATGLTPGKHGFHVHAKGDCSAADGSSAGGHYNPNDAPHGAPSASAHHVGDLGNVTADANGNVSEKIVSKTMQLTGVVSVVGKAFIIHGDADDLSSQPSGAAGPRVACGVIGVPQ